MHMTGGKGPTAMRVLGLLATVTLICFGQVAFAHATGDLAASGTPGILDPSAFDWMLFNLRLKFVFLFFIMTAIAGLARLASPVQKDGHTALAPVPVG